MQRKIKKLSPLQISSLNSRHIRPDFRVYIKGQALKSALANSNLEMKL